MVLLSALMGRLWGRCRPQNEWRARSFAVSRQRDHLPIGETHAAKAAHAAKSSEFRIDGEKSD